MRNLKTICIICQFDLSITLRVFSPCCWMGGILALYPGSSARSSRCWQCPAWRVGRCAGWLDPACLAYPAWLLTVTAIDICNPNNISSLMPAAQVHEADDTTPKLPRCPRQFTLPADIVSCARKTRLQQGPAMEAVERFWHRNERAFRHSTLSVGRVQSVRKYAKMHEVNHANQWASQCPSRLFHIWSTRSLTFSLSFCLRIEWFRSLVTP